MIRSFHRMEILARMLDGVTKNRSLLSSGGESIITALFESCVDDKAANERLTTLEALLPALRTVIQEKKVDDQ